MTNEMNGDIIIVNTDPKVCGPQTVKRKVDSCRKS